MKANIVVDILLAILFGKILVLAFWFWFLLLTILRKTWGIKLICSLQMKVFYELTVSLWVCIARHVQSTPIKVYNIFVIKNLRETVMFTSFKKYQRHL